MYSISMSAPQTPYRHAVVAGKFYPFHHGHELLIAEALRIAERASVLVCERPNEDIAADERAGWIRATFHAASATGRLEVLVVANTLPDGDSAAWGRATIAWLGTTPDVCVSSEAYGQTWAEAMGAHHHQVDRERVRIPISGTQIRKDPAAHLGWVPAATREGLERWLQAHGQGARLCDPLPPAGA